MMNSFGALRALLHAEDVDWDAVWGMVRRWPDAVELAEVVVPYMRGHLPRVPAEARARWEIPAAWMRRLAAGEVLPAAALCQSASVWWDDLPALTAAGVVLPQLRGLYMFDGRCADALPRDVRHIWRLAPQLERLDLYEGALDAADREALAQPGAPETLRTLQSFASGLCGEAGEGLASAPWTAQLEVLEADGIDALCQPDMLERLRAGGRLRELDLMESIDDAQLEQLSRWDAPPSLRGVYLSLWLGDADAEVLSRARWWPQIERANLSVATLSPARIQEVLRLTGEDGGARWHDLSLYMLDEAKLGVLAHERLSDLETLLLSGGSLRSSWTALAASPALTALRDLTLSGAPCDEASLPALPWAGGLRQLNLSGCRITSPAALRSGLTGMSALESLVLSHVPLGDVGVQALPLDEMPELHDLWLDQCELSAISLRWLLDHPALDALRVLYCAQTVRADEPPDATWRAVAEGQRTGQLTMLSLGDDAVRDVALCREALGRLAGQVRSFDIDAPLTRALAESLARTPFARLDHLALQVDGAESGALETICRASWAPQLNQLLLRGRQRGEALARARTLLRALRVRVA